mgnify:FL=1
MNNLLTDLTEYQNLIWSIVNKILCKMEDKNYKTELENELFQEGFLGLMEAQQRYDETKGIKFTTFAYPYIKGYCLKYLNNEIKINSKTKELVQNEDDIYEEDFLDVDLDIIETIKTTLKRTNRKLTELEEKILIGRINDGLDYRMISKLNNCSIKKVYNVMYKYKPLIKEIIKNNF